MTKKNNNLIKPFPKPRTTKRQREALESIMQPIDQKALETAIMKANLEDSLKENRRNLGIDYAKALGKITLPAIGVVAYAIGVQEVTDYLFKDPDLARFTGYGVSAITGYLLHRHGLVQGYIDLVRDAIDDIRYTREKVSEDRILLRNLETQA